MKLETYTKNKILFESRYQPNLMGHSNITIMSKGIRNFKLFLSIYCFDCNVAFINLDSVLCNKLELKQFTNPKSNTVGCYIKKITNRSSINTYGIAEFNKIINYITGK